VCIAMAALADVDLEASARIVIAADEALSVDDPLRAEFVSVRQRIIDYARRCADPVQVCRNGPAIRRALELTGGIPHDLSG